MVDNVIRKKNYTSKCWNVYTLHLQYSRACTVIILDVVIFFCRHIVRSLCFLTMYSIHSLRYYYYTTPIHLPLLWLQWSVFTKNFSLILKREKISTCHVFTLFNNQSQRIHLKYRMGRWPDEGGGRGIVQCKYTTSCLSASQQQPLSLVSIWIPPPPCRWRKCVCSEMPELNWG